jgi:hypothetical protein
MTAAIVIECEFGTYSWQVVEGLYSCELRADPAITTPGVTVTSATGSHKPSKSHADVQGFHSREKKNINFMPRGLNDVFPNLIAIHIENAGMKEVHQSDLKQFPQLRKLVLWNNAITIIERDLFKFNPELQFVQLGNNKITQIHPMVFDHLNKLSELYLPSNLCIDARAHDRSAVENMISRVKQECRGDTIIIDDDLQTSKQFSSLKAELTDATSKVATLDAKLRTLQQSDNLQHNLINQQKTQEEEIKKLRADLNTVLSMANETNAKHESAMQKKGEEINRLKAENEVLEKSKVAVDGLKAEVEGLKVKMAASESDTHANVTAIVDLYKSIKTEFDIAIKAIDEKNTKIENNKLRLELMQSKLELKDEMFENLGRKVDEKIEDKFDEMMARFAIIDAQYEGLRAYLNISVV